MAAEAEQKLLTHSLGSQREIRNQGICQRPHKGTDTADTDPHRLLHDIHPIDTHSGAGVDLPTMIGATTEKGPLTNLRKDIDQFDQQPLTLCNMRFLMPSGFGIQVRTFGLSKVQT